MAMTDVAASGRVENNHIGGTRIYVTLDNKSYSGTAGELVEDVTGEQLKRFSWENVHSVHNHSRIRQKSRILYGVTTLTAADGALLACEHLRHGGVWRLLCKTADGKDILLSRVKQ